MSDAGGMVLAFELDALRRLADPEAAVADAAGWSRRIGIVSDRPRAAAAFAREHDLRQDFLAGDRDKRETLALVRRTVAGERHVFVGTGPGDRTIAEALDWEYRHVEAAAERAGWETAEGADGGWLTRLLGPVVRRLPR